MESHKESDTTERLTLSPYATCIDFLPGMKSFFQESQSVDHKGYCCLPLEAVTGRLWTLITAGLVVVGLFPFLCICSDLKHLYTGYLANSSLMSV